MTNRAPVTITMSVTQVLRQWSKVLGQIDEHGVRVIVTRRGRPAGALLPMELYKTYKGKGFLITRRNVPIAALVPIRLSEAGPTSAP